MIASYLNITPEYLSEIRKNSNSPISYDVLRISRNLNYNLVS